MEGYEGNSAGMFAQGLLRFDGTDKPDREAENQGGFVSAFADQLVEKVALEEALLKAPQGRRVRMALHFVGGFTYQEFRAIVGISEQAVRKRVGRVGQDFRNVYGMRLGGNGE